MVVEPLKKRVVVGSVNFPTAHDKDETLAPAYLIYAFKELSKKK